MARVIVLGLAYTAAPTARQCRMLSANRSRRRNATISVLLLLAVLAAYGATLGNDFVNYDDPEYVTENRMVRAGLTLAGLRWAAVSAHSANWHPLTWLSHMLDCELYGLRPAGHHLTSVVLHGANAVLLFAALARLTGSVGPSAVVAALFALHPLRAESVAWVAERKDVLSGLFWMLGLLAYARWVERPGPGRYLAVAGAFALGLLAKPMVVTLPFVLLLLDWWPLRRPVSVRLLVEKVPLFLLAALSSVVTFVVQERAGALPSLEVLPLATRVENALLAYVRYLVKTVWPSRLAAFYPLDPSIPLATVAAAAGLLVLITAVCLLEARRRPYLATGWLWYLGTLVPVIGLVKAGEQAMADRFTYLPQVGLLVMVAWGAAEIVTRWRLGAGVCAAMGGAMLAACMVTTWVQVGYWHDSVTLFEHALDVTDGNYVAHMNLGTALLGEGRLAAATAHLRRAAEIRPGHAQVRVNLGRAFAASGDPEAAVAQYLEALRIAPTSAMAHYNLGVVLAEHGRTDEAVGHYEEAVRIDPSYAKAHHNLGLVLATQGRLEAAVLRYREALRLDPDLAAAHNSLAIALESLGQPREALDHYREAVRLSPANALAHYNLAAVLWGDGLADEAIAHYEAAVRLRADWPQALEALAATYAGAGRQVEAIATAERALALARGKGEAALAAEIEERLRSYRTRQPAVTDEPRG